MLKLSDTVFAVSRVRHRSYTANGPGRASRAVGGSRPGPCGAVGPVPRYGPQGLDDVEGGGRAPPCGTHCPAWGDNGALMARRCFGPPRGQRRQTARRWGGSAAGPARGGWSRHEETAAPPGLGSRAPPPWAFVAPSRWSAGSPRKGQKPCQGVPSPCFALPGQSGEAAPARLGAAPGRPRAAGATWPLCPRGAPGKPPGVARQRRGPPGGRHQRPLAAAADTRLAGATVAGQVGAGPSPGLLGHRGDPLARDHGIRAPPAGPARMPCRRVATRPGAPRGGGSAGDVAPVRRGHGGARHRRGTPGVDTTCRERRDVFCRSGIRGSPGGLGPTTGPLRLESTLGVQHRTALGLGLCDHRSAGHPCGVCQGHGLSDGHHLSLMLRGKWPYLNRIFQHDNALGLMLRPVTTDMFSKVPCHRGEGARRLP